MRRREHGGIFFRLLGLIFFFALIAVLYVLRHPLMRFAGEIWEVNDPVVQADVVIVLGDDNYAADRCFHAAELYRTGLAPVVVVSGRMLRAKTGIAEIMENDLESFGVPAASIVPFSHRAENMLDQAQALAGFIKQHGWKRVLIVTSNYQARRAQFIFSRVLPPGISVQVSGAHDSEFDPSRWWESRVGQKLFLNEVFGYAVARWELRNHSIGQSGATLVLKMLPTRLPKPHASMTLTPPYLIGNTPGLQSSVRVL